MFPNAAVMFPNAASTFGLKPESLALKYDLPLIDSTSHGRPGRVPPYRCHFGGRRSNDFGIQRFIRLSRRSVRRAHRVSAWSSARTESGATWVTRLELNRS